jgi:hypothetical protein
MPLFTASSLVTSIATPIALPPALLIVGHRVRAVLVQVGDRDGRAGLRQLQRDFLADAARGAVTTAVLPFRSAAISDLTLPFEKSRAGVAVPACPCGRASAIVHDRSRRSRAKRLA